MPTCNNTLDEQIINEVPLYGDVTFHKLGLFLSAVFGLIATFVSLFLIFAHATHYLKPWEQRHIIRIVLLIPVYAIVSFFSYYFYRHAIYYDIAEGCYEAFAISSFFTLLCNYIAPNLHEQKEYFRSLKPKNWFWGVFGLQKCTGGEYKGFLRKPRSGLTWFNIIWIGIFQYCFIRVLFSIVAVLAQVGGVYCEDSLSPAFAHVWVEVFEAASVTIAMFCLIQFYIQLKDDLAEHRPFLKVLCIKLVIFFSFWQTIVISFISSSKGPLAPTKKIAYNDIKVGIPSMLLCIEMAIFAVMHVFAFSWKPYSIKHSYSDPINQPGGGFSSDAVGTTYPGDSGGAGLKYQGGRMGLWAFAEAFNPWDIIKMTARGFRWLFVGYRSREQDPSYQTPSKVNFPTAAGPTFAGNGDLATELSSNSDGRRPRADTAADDDQAGLLSYQSQMGRGPHTSPPRPYGQDSLQGSLAELGADASQRTNLHPGINPQDFDAKPGDFEEQDTSYHPVHALTTNSPPPGALHPALRENGGVHGQDWNFFGGADAQR